MSIKPFDPLPLFPHPTLTAITGVPTRATIKQLEKENKDNARRIRSTRAPGREGHLRLCYTLADYNARPIMAAANQWIDPIHPGPRANIPDGATAANIARLTNEHQFSLQEFDTFEAVEHALIKTAMAAIEPVYYVALEDPDEGFTQLRYIDLIVHLLNSMDNSPMRTSTTTSKHEHKVDTYPTTRTTLRQINKAIAFARGHDPITDRAALRSGLDNLEKSGVFPRAMESWNEKPDDEQTWENFKTHFTAANRERRRKLTTKQAGYHDQHKPTTPTTKKAPTTHSTSTMHPAPPTWPTAGPMEPNATSRTPA
ncbi:hypothetical protein SEMRO_3937_G351990.1 [Seminavis robusta]|uniref:Uncharacterized protein n=1 Tax=Seminavis robusta TaxID=568900 RepID=A0A9N8HZQ7_9STRA|nr:hypothetical protein SEMRO_3937_G351990.1 [Seminavis robusta]|eukprot:Sro3937_g351990.1 n/a (312) ;mRNA; f:958-1893